MATSPVTYMSSGHVVLPYRDFTYYKIYFCTHASTCYVQSFLFRFLSWYKAPHAVANTQRNIAFVKNECIMCEFKLRHCFESSTFSTKQNHNKPIQDKLSLAYAPIFCDAPLAIAMSRNRTSIAATYTVVAAAPSPKWTLALMGDDEVSRKIGNGIFLRRSVHDTSRHVSP